MKTNIATDSLQSQRLLGCGVSADTADMYISNYDDLWASPFKDNQRKDEKGFTPAWSLSRLLALLPTSLLATDWNEYMLELSKLRMHDAYEVQWFNGRNRFTTRDKKKVFHKLWDKSPIEACVKAIEWLTANGYKLNE